MVILQFIVLNKRKGNQLYGDGNLYETPFRNYDPRLGRWLSPDPIQHPWQGSYTAFNNNPIYFVNPMGLEGDENDGSGDNDTKDLRGVTITAKRHRKAVGPVVRMIRNSLRDAKRNAKKKLRRLDRSLPYVQIWGSGKGTRSGSTEAPAGADVSTYDMQGKFGRTLDILMFGMPSGKPGSGGPWSKRLYGNSNTKRSAESGNKFGETAQKVFTKKETSKDVIIKKRRDQKIRHGSVKTDINSKVLHNETGQPFIYIKKVYWNGGVNT
jgi:RHS repeat-associated protein